MFVNVLIHHRLAAGLGVGFGHVVAHALGVIKAGHVEIVGDERVAPLKLISILQQSGILKPTEPERKASLNLLLTKLYGKAD